MKAVELEILVRCYYVREPLPKPVSMAFDNAIKSLSLADLIEPESGTDKDFEGVYIATPKGIAHIVKLLSIPEPELVWLHDDDIDKLNTEA